MIQGLRRDGAGLGHQQETTTDRVRKEGQPPSTTENREKEEGRQESEGGIYSVSSNAWKFWGKKREAVSLSYI